LYLAALLKKEKSKMQDVQEKKSCTEKKVKEVQKKETHLTKKQCKKKKVKQKFRSACILFSPCAEKLLLAELGPGRV
jgi:hypothetical protein